MRQSPLIDKPHLLIIARHPVGGIRTFLRYVYKHLDPCTYRVTLLLPEELEHNALVNDLEFLNPSYVLLPPGYTVFDFVRKVFGILRTQNADLVHSNGLVTGALTALPAWLTRTPHIVTQHDVFTGWFYRGVKGYVIKKVLSFLLGFSDVIHSVGDDAKENLLQHLPSLGRKGKRLVVIRNGIDVKRFSDATRENLRLSLGLADDTFLIGFLGRFMAQKGFRYLVDAVEILTHDYGLSKEIVVVTFGWGGFIREDMAMVKERKLDRHFRSMPFSPNIASVLKGLDVVAMPSLWEAYSVLAMEAMVAGVPIIGSDCIGLREVLNDTPSVMVPTRNGHALAAAIFEEIRSPSRVKAEAFRKEAAKRFDARKTAKALARLFEQVREGKNITTSVSDGPVTKEPPLGF